MANLKMVKRVVKGPKGLYIQGKDGAFYCAPEGTKVELSEQSAANHVKRGHLFAIGEFEAMDAAASASIQASQDEKAARDADPDKDEDEPTSVSIKSETKPSATPGPKTPTSATKKGN